MNCRSIFLVLLFFAPASLWAEQRFQVTGLVTAVDAPHQTVVVSHDRIPGYMEAMVMPYHVRDQKMLDDLKPGMKIAFTLVVTKTASYIADARVDEYVNLERDPDQARRLNILDAVMHPNLDSFVMIKIGQTVPNFALVDQRNSPVTLSQFEGKVVAITFIYTRCPLPDYCLRMSNNFGRLQKRFGERMGRDLVLLSVTFDPEHDQPEVLKKYAKVWKADVEGWRFLTGPLGTVKQICGLFGMNFWPDEGLMTHSLHTVVIDRDGTLAANLEGNQFTAAQLGDLVEATLAHGSLAPKGMPR
jgi:protein SCO1/2